MLYLILHNDVASDVAFSNVYENYNDNRNISSTYIRKRY